MTRKNNGQGQWLWLWSLRAIRTDHWTRNSERNFQMRITRHINGVWNEQDSPFGTDKTWKRWIVLPTFCAFHEAVLFLLPHFVILFCSYCWVALSIRKNIEWVRSLPIIECPNIDFNEMEKCSTYAFKEFLLVVVWAGVDTSFIFGGDLDFWLFSDLKK